jgi:hypothetical protein
LRDIFKKPKEEIIEVQVEGLPECPQSREISTLCIAPHRENAHRVRLSKEVDIVIIETKKKKGDKIEKQEVLEMPETNKKTWSERGNYFH